MKKKTIQVLQVMHDKASNEWTVVFIMTKDKIGMVVPVIEPDARHFITELDLKEIPDRTGSIWQ